MTNNASKMKHRGRPLSYQPELVYEVVERLLENGTPRASIDASLVKQELCQTYGIKDTIRLESLKRVVDDAVSELQQNQDRALLSTLPETVTASIDHFMKGARDAFAILVAEQNAKCQAEAETRCAELQFDKRSAQRHISELEAEITQLQKDKQKLVEQRDCSIADAAYIRNQLSEIKEEVTRLRGANDFAQQLMDQYKQYGGSVENQTDVVGRGQATRREAVSSKLK
ncbi:hypothetical protein GLP59_10615 [Sulfitobacter sp. M220]|jgi:hypothetical protein|uniref:hypothetical protein n=1 Tax=unclassified Sulfitobacter TaxID=196795 RepID=UPI001EEFE14F|nr:MULTISPECIES: hypothetical protein [unclassified Sulfitobacter]MCF7726712.1 hypothetical protein [Sulfitobacter sp. M22]MCF7778092.1 hypothetical protein [Sulfitobacter sp. M220]|tara:strand:+ start:248 stop:931 length:684 start_codon:yes stop_codon:yes gene_type:complete